jgi:phosphate transport system substrate-binding protein
MTVRWMNSVLISLVLLSMSACRAAPRTHIIDRAATAASQTGRLTFAGSTTVQPLAAELGEAYNAQHPDVILEIVAGGSGVGIKAVHDGTVDIGMASRHLTPEELVGIETHPVAVDVIAIVVNIANPVGDLTLEQLHAIYTGSITNWAEAGGPHGEIMVAVRETTSGTRKAFDELVLDSEDTLAPNVASRMTAGDVAAFVAQHETAIGYVGFGNLEEGLRVVSINSVMPTADTARSGTYPLMRPLLFLTGPLSQPLADDFVGYALSEEGQGIVTRSGWIPAK